MPPPSRALSAHGSGVSAAQCLRAGPLSSSMSAFDPIVLTFALEFLCLQSLGACAAVALEWYCHTSPRAETSSSWRAHFKRIAARHRWQTCSSCTTLDMSSSSQEELNISDATTLAAFLASSATIVSLTASGRNMGVGVAGLRDQRIYALGVGLQLNESLTFLDLSDNMLGSRGAEALAGALNQASRTRTEPERGPPVPREPRGALTLPSPTPSAVQHAPDRVGLLEERRGRTGARRRERGLRAGGRLHEARSRSSSSSRVRPASLRVTPLPLTPF